jgi:hypothetical protein
VQQKLAGWSKTPLRGHATTMLIPWKISILWTKIPITQHVDWKPSLTYLHNSQSTHDGAIQETNSVCTHVCKIKCNKNKLFPTQDSLSVKWHFPPFTPSENCTYKYHTSLKPIHRQFNPVHILALHSFNLHSNHILSVPISYMVHIRGLEL